MAAIRPPAMQGCFMTLNDVASLGNIIAAMAVVASLFYLSRQVRLANLFALSQVRQRMVEQTHEELYVLMNNPDLRDAWRRSVTLSGDAQSKLSFFLAAAMRQREWEWFQYRDGIITHEVYQAYHEVIAFHLGAPRTRNWWATVGRLGFNPDFVAEVDALLAARPLTDGYFDKIRCFDAADASSDGAELEKDTAKQQAG
jgi:hypothetical protein